jgi:hypothetical protein
MKYASLKEVPSEMLAHNVVGSLIFCEGDLHKYKEVIAVLIRELRGEPHPPEIQTALDKRKRNELGGLAPPNIDPYGELSQ